MGFTRYIFKHMDTIEQLTEGSVVTAYPPSTVTFY